MKNATYRPPPTGPTAWLLLLAFMPFGLKAATVAFEATGYLAQSSYKFAQIAAPVYWRYSFGNRRGWSVLWPFEQGKPAGPVWLAAIAIAALLAGTAVLAILLLAGPLALDRAELKAGLDAKFSLTPALALGIVVYLFTWNAALEELHFRAWLDRELHARFGAIAGTAGSATAFAAMHLFIFADLPVATPLLLVLVFLSLALAGAAWSWLRRRPGGIHAAWLSHGLTDAGLLTWGLFWLGYF
ncbi:MAG: CPBP family intramembrane metalloprotease [Planctomycetales bacterium]|nr:CPBP family intramembrane metalloprotease [Planctomycetales bacterium]